jgi:hypothetical protein
LPSRPPTHDFAAASARCRSRAAGSTVTYCSAQPCRAVYAERVFTLSDEEASRRTRADPPFGTACGSYSLIAKATQKRSIWRAGPGRRMSSGRNRLPGHLPEGQASGVTGPPAEGSRVDWADVPDQVRAEIERACRCPRRGGRDRPRRAQPSTGRPYALRRRAAMVRQGGLGPGESRQLHACTGRKPGSSVILIR